MVKLKEQNPEVKETGTTTLGMICRDTVVLAAEKKSVMGYLIASKDTEKLIPIDDHLVMTTAGVSGDAQALARYLKAELKLFSIQNKRKIGVKGAAILLSNILQGNKYYPYYVQLIVAGFDEGGPKIFSLDAIGGWEEENKFFATGSGSPFAFGVLEDNYKEGMSADEGSKLAIRAVKSAIERDIGSGGKGIDVAIISKDGIRFIKHEFAEKLVKQV